MNKITLAALLLIFAKLVSANTDSLNLHGEGTYTWWGIKVYDARLFVAQDFSGDALNARPIALEITYDIDIDVNDLVDTTEEEWDDLKIGNTKTCSAREDWAKELRVLWPNLKQGDTLRYFADANGKQAFSHNGKVLGEIDDKNFHSCFLAIWLADDTNADDLRDELLKL